jgi:hypothetical protein
VRDEEITAQKIEPFSKALGFISAGVRIATRE